MINEFVRVDSKDTPVLIIYLLKYVANIILCDFTHQSEQSFEHTTEQRTFLVKRVYQTANVILIQREFRVKFLCRKALNSRKPIS
jgi:hypothetical protein